MSVDQELISEDDSINIAITGGTALGRHIIATNLNQSLQRAGFKNVDIEGAALLAETFPQSAMETALRRNPEFFNSPILITSWDEEPATEPSDGPGAEPDLD